jgi:hypothetical protein
MYNKYIKNIFPYLLQSQNKYARILQTFYYRCRYYLILFNVKLYYLWNNYPNSKIFLTISTNNLEYTDFNENGHRMISSRTKKIHQLLGRVAGGDWDLNRTHITSWPIYRSLEQHFIRGVNLRDTSYFIHQQRMTTKNGIWHQISDKNYDKEFERNTRLYKSLKKYGYKTQKELGNPNYLDEIRVKIGRDGTFLWENSIHRFVLAKIIGLKTVTVVVTIRHREWILLKQRLLRSAKTGNRFSDSINGMRYNHPDLYDIPYTHNGHEILEEHMKKHSIKSTQSV